MRGPAGRRPRLWTWAYLASIAALAATPPEARHGAPRGHPAARPGPAAPAAPAAAPALPAPSLLVPGRAVERALAPGESHRYDLRLAAGETLHAIVEQRGAAVSMQLERARAPGAGGAPLLAAPAVGGPSLDRGDVELHAVAGGAGEYRLTLTGGRESAGSYRLRLDPPRAASPRDRARATAQQTLAVADRCRGEGRPAAAAAAYRQAAEQWRRSGEPQLALVARYRLGAAREDLHQFRQALAEYRAVLGRWRRRAEGDAVLDAMGRCYRELGMMDEAAAAFRQAAAQSARLGDGRERAAALNRLATILARQGDFQTALALFDEALRGFGALHDEAAAARVLSNVGEAHIALGAWPDAIAACREALAIHTRLRPLDADRGKLMAMRDLAAAYLGLRQWPQARAQLERTLKLARQAHDELLELTSLNGLAYVHLMSGEVEPAIGAAHASLRLARARGSQRGEANALGNLGAALGRRGDTRQALACLARARRIYARRHETGDEAVILFGRAEVLERAGRLDEASATIAASLQLVERLRTRATGSGLRASFFATRQDAWELAVRVLMELDRLRPGQGYDARAFAASERTRARTFLEELAAARLDLAAGADPAPRAREAAVRQRLAAVQGQRDLAAIGAAPESAARLAPLDAEIRRLRSRLEQVHAEMRSHDRRYRLLHEARPLTLPEIQRQVLDPGTLLLAYSLGGEESYLWSIGPDSCRAHRLPARAAIDRAATAAYEALAAPPGAVDPVEQVRRIAELAALVLAPVRDELAGKRLLIVADGALQYIPFAALPEPPAGSGTGSASRPLLAAHEIVNLPSASVAALLHRQTAHRPAPGGQLAVLADPVFRRDDPRVASSAGAAAAPLAASTLSPAGAAPAAGENDAERSARDVGLGRLPRVKFTRDEADAILRLVPPTLALRATDFAASRDLALSPELGRYRILHFATHGFLDSRQPELSGLVFSLVDPQGRPREGFLHAYEVYGLRLSAELVVLSACRTALGAEVRGEGLMGLTRGFMYAGAPRVLVSLWNISDHATAELMARFYDCMLRQHLPPSAALRAAQLATREHWPSPYHWAAFELQGDWRASGWR
jgi:CHAT domain-containing protein/tetratricopeptide (TPR) repeat protein